MRGDLVQDRRRTRSAPAKSRGVSMMPTSRLEIKEMKNIPSRAEAMAEK